MAKTETQTQTVVETVVLGAGPIIVSNHSLMVKAYADQNGEALKAQRAWYESLCKVVAEYRQADNKLYDAATSGYMNSDWINGQERLVKKDADKPRGRKAAPKPNHSANC